MPIYEYECRACGHYLDTLQKVSDPPLTVCPDCGEEALRKRVSAPRFRLKGDGWYETDFKTGDKRNLHETQGAEKKSDKKSEPKKDAPKASKGGGSSGDGKAA